MAGDLTTHDQVASLFSNFTWTRQNLTVEEQAMLNHWETPYSGVLINLSAFVAFTVSKQRTIEVVFLDLCGVNFIIQQTN